MSMDMPPQETQQKQLMGDNTFRFLVNVLGDYWLLILAGTIAGAILVGGVSLFLREPAADHFESTAEILVQPSPWEKGLLGEIGGVTLSATPTKIRERTNLSTVAEETAAAMIQADIQEAGFLGRIVSKDETQRLAKQIEGKLRIEPAENEHKLRVIATKCASKKEAENVAEYATRVLLVQNQQVENEEHQAQHDFLRQELERLRKTLRDATSREWDYKKQVGFRNTGQVDSTLATTQTKLDELTATREETERKLKELDAELARNTELLPASLGRISEEAVTGIKRDLDKLLQDKLSLSQVYQPGWEGLQEVDAQLEEKKQALLDAINQLDQSAAGANDTWKQRQDIYRKQMDLRVRQTATEVEIASMQRVLEELVPKIPELANQNQKSVELAQETERYRKLFRERLDQEWKLRQALAKGTGTVERQGSISPASLMPMGARRTNVWVSFFVGGILGLLISFALAMLLNANDTSIRSIEDVNAYIGLEVLGTIPKMRFGKPRGGRRRRATYVTTVDEEQIDACIVTQHDPKSPISEAYRTLRTNFQFATISQHPKTVMVTSAVPGEGKTTTAVNLAVTMADRGIRVLIVDTDLRRPNVHRVLRMERGPGLADVLREGLDIHSVIRSTRVDNLWIISSGRVPPNPSELIGSDLMDRVMKQLAGEFDLIVCDAPSVLVVTDPVLLATHVETCIMVVSTNNARRETVIRAKKLLETAKVNVVGVVVNGLETGRRHYYYYYYYYDDGAPMRRKWYHFY